MTTEPPLIPNLETKNVPEDINRITRYQMWHLAITGSALLAAICTVIFLALQVRNVATQTQKQTEAIELQSSLLKVQAYQAFANSWAQIDLAFMNHPELRPFFYGGKTTSDPKAHMAALSLAEMHLDIFETFFMDELTGHLPFGRKGTKDRENWESFMHAMFERSSLLCNRLKEVSDWYSEEFRSFASPSCEKRGVKLK